MHTYRFLPTAIIHQKKKNPLIFTADRHGEVLNMLVQLGAFYHVIRVIRRLTRFSVDLRLTIQTRLAFNTSIWWSASDAAQPSGISGCRSTAKERL
ncbi:hypothetical protein AMECASPLE_025484 [Ameca splendens]|uniref:Uncharacterized protein n=1 Tax=Ameca splendens TaxID=208324 RepID=A0ABV0ZDP0_9TELE